MSYTRIKTIKGRQYKYLVSGVREGNSVRQKVIKYLGPVEPKYKIGKKREKTNASIYAREIKIDERAELDRATKNTQAFTRDRAKIIILSSQHLFSGQIAQKLSFDERKIRAAIKAFNSRGIQSLQRKKAPGAIQKFTPTIKQVILMHFSKEPHSFGEAFTTWTLPRFKKHLIEYNVVENISIEQLRQIIYRAGAKLKRSKRWQYSPDKDFHKKNNE
ncbi:MAG: helix-turn-helix domain-containing protein [Nanoarchaeota archaeon]